ncbi:TIR domain-containing protein [Vitreimonas flagellata]|uniref:TIR domain-containing protein n=1 Tax=Vitreimonas flagellata TaxID=2560861 RepID=UPI001431EEE7|nr:TIR domain-containing protein [Vitreimonas flagellata]
MPHVLWIDDDPFVVRTHADRLEDQGFTVLHALNASAGLALYEQHRDDVVAVIVDMAMEPGDRFSSLQTRGGFSAGLAVARNIFHRNAHVRLMALSSFDDPQARAWFKEHGFHYLLKGRTTGVQIDRIVRGETDAAAMRDIPSFIVHGHDDEAVRDLRAFLESTWGISAPVVLRDMPHQGLTILEKLEHHLDHAFVAFVLLTPDDEARALAGGATRTRARQNVIFELGYFFGRVGRREGRVVILTKGAVELPSDLHGIGTIDISAGFAVAGPAIIRELQDIFGASTTNA